MPTCVDKGTITPEAISSLPAASIYIVLTLFSISIPRPQLDSEPIPSSDNFHSVRLFFREKGNSHHEAFSHSRSFPSLLAEMIIYVIFIMCRFPLPIIHQNGAHCDKESARKR